MPGAYHLWSFLQRVLVPSENRKTQRHLTHVPLTPADSCLTTTWSLMLARAICWTGNGNLTTLQNYICWLTLGLWKSFYTSSLDIFGSRILCITLDIKPASDICEERVEAICSVGAWPQSDVFLFFGSKSSPSTCCLLRTDCIKVMQALLSRHFSPFVFVSNCYLAAFVSHCLTWDKHNFSPRWQRHVYAQGCVTSIPIPSQNNCTNFSGLL